MASHQKRSCLCICKQPTASNGIAHQTNINKLLGMIHLLLPGRVYRDPRQFLPGSGLGTSLQPRACGGYGCLAETQPRMWSCTGPSAVLLIWINMDLVPECLTYVYFYTIILLSMVEYTYTYFYTYKIIQMYDAMFLFIVTSISIVIKSPIHAKECLPCTMSESTMTFKTATKNWEFVIGEHWILWGA